MTPPPVPHLWKTLTHETITVTHIGEMSFYDAYMEIIIYVHMNLINGLYLLTHMLHI